MVDTGFSLNNICVSLLVLATAAMTWAQTFQKPSLDTPTTMKEGTQYTISCSCISTGENVSLALKRSDQSNVISSSTQCEVVTGDTILCNSIYKFEARLEDTGVQVICTAVQKGNPESKTDTTTLDVMAKPRSTISNPVISTNIGMTVNLTCETDANPPATIYDWSFDGATLNEIGPNLQVDVTNTSFGEYTCNATNTIGTSDPILLTLKEKPLSRPKSNISNPVITATVDMVVTLDCQTVANPPATHFNWSFNDVTLAETGSSLEVNITDASLFGEYKCVATNSVGTSDPILLTLKQVTASPSSKSTGHSISAALSACILILITQHIVY